MFSFFKSKKPSPVDPIPGAIPGPPREDEFIFIERRDNPPKGGGESSTKSPGEPSLYPAIPGTPTSASDKNPPVDRQRSEEKGCHGMSGVPFKLAPELCRETSNELTRIQVNDILSYGVRAMYMPEYDFSVERSVLNS